MVKGTDKREHSKIKLDYSASLNIVTRPQDHRCLVLVFLLFLHINMVAIFVLFCHLFPLFSCFYFVHSADYCIFVPEKMLLQALQHKLLGLQYKLLGLQQKKCKGLKKKVWFINKKSKGNGKLCIARAL